MDKSNIYIVFFITNVEKKLIIIFKDIYDAKLVNMQYNKEELRKENTQQFHRIITNKYVYFTDHSQPQLSEQIVNCLIILL